MQYIGTGLIYPKFSSHHDTFHVLLNKTSGEVLLSKRWVVFVFFLGLRSDEINRPESYKINGLLWSIFKSKIILKNILKMSVEDFKILQKKINNVCAQIEEKEKKDDVISSDFISKLQKENY